MNSTYLTREDLAKILHKVCEIAGESALRCDRKTTSADIVEGIREVASRLDGEVLPPTGKLRWPRREARYTTDGSVLTQVEVYPAGVVEPVVKALELALVTIDQHPRAKAALAAFRAVCR